MSNGYKYGYKRDYNKKSEAQSRDRVHFTVPAQYLMKKSIRECVEETLGIRSAQSSAMASADQDLHIICRPSQFARFVILRHIKYNEPNNMACLDMRLVLPIPEPTAIDVSGNPNESGGSHIGDQASTRT